MSPAELRRQGQARERSHIPTYRRREEAAEAPSAHQPQGERGGRSGPATPRVRMKRPEFLA